MLELHWLPQTCDLLPLSRKETFCAGLGGRDLLIVGDSKSAQLYDELQLFVLQEGRFDPGAHKSVTICRDFYERVGMRPPTLRWVLSRKADRVSKESGYGHWRAHVHRRNDNNLLPVVVIGTGSWFRSDEAGLRRALAALLFFFQDALEQRPQPIYWKTNTVPILGCENMAGTVLQTPFNPASPEARRGYADDPSNRLQKYGWQLLPSHRRFVDWYFPLAKVTVLDLWAPSAYRPDALHGNEGKKTKGSADCWHFCMPGLNTVFAQILYNHLMGWIPS